ncbi:Hint domain-containing protein [Yoonia vestfoldensis]|uniref:Hint domain-containing protein n=1 Tax=Yoonia vestfoldensis TaxID=245188 RepID=UPI00039989F9|nr:Hint domain-containing protein [Yoonia vestfoldensis]
MAITFTVFSLGQLPIWDPQEGNNTLATGAVNAALGTYGSTGDPLFNERVTFAPAGNGFGGGSPDSYDLDNNNSNDQFSINGGPVQTFDASMIFNATITYIDGTTANITAVVFQDSAGNTYWAPEFEEDPDQLAIEAKAIRALTLISPIYTNGFGTGYNLAANRFDSQPLCFTPGTLIDCPGGPRDIDTLAVGDLVLTRDHGAQPIRWIGRRSFAAVGRMAPIRIRAGLLNAGRDVEFSPQHRILIADATAELLFGEPEVFAAAKSLVDGDAISIRTGGEVEYIHLLCDRHEIISANGLAAETLFLGEVTTQTLDPDSIAEIDTIFPGRRNTVMPLHRMARPALRHFEPALWVQATASRGLARTG